MPITYLDNKPQGKITYLDEKPEEKVGFFGSVPKSAYQTGQRNIMGNVMERPAAALRSLIQGKGYWAGAENPTNVPTFQELALEKFAPKTKSTALNFLGGLIPSGAGLAADIATNPANLLMAILPKLPLGAGKTLGGVVAGSKPGQAIGRMANAPIQLPKATPEQLIGKAEKLTTEILNPTKQALSRNIIRGQKTPAVEQAAKVITKSKTYRELGNNLDDVVKTSFGERNAILSKNNFKVTPDYMKPLQEMINAEQISGQVTPAEIQQMQGVLNRELKFFNQKGLTRIEAQARKEYFQDLTQRLLKQKTSGGTLVTQPARLKAMDALRSGLKTAVEGNDPEVAQINSTYEGLKEARRLVADQQALADKAITPGFTEKLLQKLPIIKSFFNPKDIPGQITKAVAGRQGTLAKKTVTIQELMRKANKLR